MDGFFLFPLMISIAIIEMFLSVNWNKIYFTLGLPIFRKHVKFKHFSGDIDSLVNNLNIKFKSDGITSSQYFKKIDLNKIAFREKYFDFSLLTYTPVMHGKIIIDCDKNEFEVLGLSNWFMMAFLFMWYSTFLDHNINNIDIIFLLAPIGIIGFIYYIQLRKYKKIIFYLYSLLEQQH